MNAKILELYDQYTEDYKRERSEAFKGFRINFGQYEAKLHLALMDEFGFTGEQVKYILEAAYDRYHSAWGDIFFGAREMAEFVAKFPKS